MAILGSDASSGAMNENCCKGLPGKRLCLPNQKNSPRESENIQPLKSRQSHRQWIKIQGSKSPEPSQSSQSDPLQEDNGGVKKKTCWTKLCWTTEQCEWVFEILLQRKIPSRRRIQHWVELDKEFSARFGHGLGAERLKKMARCTLLRMLAQQKLKVQGSRGIELSSEIESANLNRYRKTGWNQLKWIVTSATNDTPWSDMVQSFNEAFDISCTAGDIERYNLVVKYSNLGLPEDDKPKWTRNSEFLHLANKVLRFRDQKTETLTAEEADQAFQWKLEGRATADIVGLLLQKFGTYHLAHVLDGRLVKIAVMRNARLKGVAEIQNRSQEQLTWVSKQIERRENLINLQALHVPTADFNAKFGTCWNLCYYLQNHWKYWTKWSRPWKNWIEEHIDRNLVDDQTFDWSGLTVEFNTKFGTKDTAIGILTWH